MFSTLDCTQLMPKKTVRTNRNQSTQANPRVCLPDAAFRESIVTYYVNIFGLNFQTKLSAWNDIIDLESNPDF